MSPARSWLARFLTAGLVAVFCTATAAAQQGIGTVRGVVTDDVSRRPISAAQVYVPGLEALGTITDSEGQFELNLPQGAHRLTVRRVGYATSGLNITVTAGQVTETNFQLKQVVILLDEVVVTGAGAATEKKRLGNTVASIKTSELENAPTANFSELLAGREPNVSVIPSGGYAGEGARIRIRGSASLSQSNEPIIYVDGIRVDNGGGIQGTNVGSGGGGGTSRLDDINPDAIERVEILKGAAAATLYGTEASNGVIQIFTKKGAQGAPKFDFSLEVGATSPNSDRIKKNTGFVRAGDEARLSQFWANSPICRNLSGGSCASMSAYDIFEVDYYDALFETGFNQAYSGSVSGGSSIFTYFVSGRFSSDQGQITTKPFDGLADDFNRLVQASANMEIIPHEKVRLRINSQVADVGHKTPENGNNIWGLIPSAMDAKPERATCDTSFGNGTPNGDGTCDPVGNPEGATFATTREIAQTFIEQDVRHYTLSLQTQYTPVAELSLDATVGLDYTSTENVIQWPFAWNVDGLAGADPLGNRGIDNRNRREITVETKAQWDARFGENFSSTFVAGGQGFIARTTQKGGFGADFPGPGLGVAGAAASQSVSESFLEVVNAGAFAQEQFGLYDVVFLTGGLRYDRNSAFGEQTEGTLYPKASISIVPSDLPYWNIAPLSTFRVRAAWGKSGLQPGAFDKFTTFAATASALGPGLTPDNLGNDALEPEKATEIELGAEFGLFDNRLGLDFTWWDRSTKDALFSRQFAPSGGFTNQQIVNIGQVDANGLEFNLTGLVVNKPDFSVRFFGNAAYLTETVTDLGGSPPLKVGASYIRYRAWLVEGWSPGAFFGNRLLPTQPGFFAIDTNGDGQPDSEAEVLAFFANPVSSGFSSSAIRPLVENCDASQSTPGPQSGPFGCYLGKPTPDWQGSFGLNIGILGNLEISSLWEYKAGNFFVHNLTDSFRSTHSLIGRNFEQATAAERTLVDPSSTAQDRLAAWRVFSEELKHLAPLSGLNAVRPADFVRWRELSLTYRLPVDFVRSKLGLRYVTLNVAARNLALWTKYDGIDPELNLISRGNDSNTAQGDFAQSLDAWGIPVPTRFTFNVRFGF